MQHKDVTINGHIENSFYYVIFQLKYDLILGKPWIEKNGVQYHPESERLWIWFFKIKIEYVFGKKTMKLDCIQISSSGFYISLKNPVETCVFVLITEFSTAS